MYKKLLSILTAGCICISTLITASAATVSSQDLLEDSKVDRIVTALNFIEETKSTYGLDDVDFNDLELGSSITTYEYIDNTFEVLGEMVPIFSGDKIIASAFDVGDGNYSVETFLANEIDKMGFEDIAIVYDRDEVYLFNGSDFVLLKKSDICITVRDDIDLDSLKNKKHHIVTTNVNANSRIRLNLDTMQAKATVPPYVECDVEYVTQLPYDKLCWAACVAMVKNYKSGTSLTTPDVAKKYFGTVKNEAISGEKIQDCMKRLYGLDYTYRSTAPKENIIGSNLSEDWPVIGVFSWSVGTSNGRHACVITLDNPFSYYISLLDPMYGGVAATGSNGTFSYVDSSSGVTMTLTAGLCHTWTYG